MLQILSHLTATTGTLKDWHPTIDLQIVKADGVTYLILDGDVFALPPVRAKKLFHTMDNYKQLTHALNETLRDQIQEAGGRDERDVRAAS